MWKQGQYLRLVIVGGGPAGLAPLLAAHRDGELGALLDDGVVVVERSARLGSGSIGGYAINSDSSGRTFVDCLLCDVAETRGQPQTAKSRNSGGFRWSRQVCGWDTELTRLADHPLTRRLADAGDGTVALRDAGQFLGLVGEAMGRVFAEHPASRVLTTHHAASITRTAGGWSVRVRDLATGAEQTLLTRHVVLATGAEQPAGRLAAETVAGVNLVQRCAGRLLQSGDVLAAGGLEHVAGLLAAKPDPRVVIVGGSTSAASVAHALLHRLPQVRFGAGGVTLLHRRELRIYYPDRASALAEGYAEWTEDDVCPVSGKVFRFAGFRLDARELVMQARGIGGRPPEPRVRLHRLGPDDAGAVRLLDGADLVIAALGYRPRALPVHGRDGRPITLLSQTGPQQPLVDGQCRVLDGDGRPVPGLFGIGLGAGFVPRGRLGGEASFRGQANGLWLWQHDVGSLIVDAVMRPSASALALPDGLLCRALTASRPAPSLAAVSEGV